MQTSKLRPFSGYRSNSLFQIGKILFLSTVSAGLVWLPQPSAATAPGCNIFGCWEKGGGCNVSGCWEKGGGCNVSGCWEKGGGCNVSGCWDSPNRYRRSDNYYDVTDYDLAFSKAIGGVVTTNVQDLMRFTQGLFGGELLKSESLNELLTLVDTGLGSSNGGEFRYKFGLGVDNSPSPWGTTLGKGGTNAGNSAQILYLPDRGIFAVELENGVNSQAPFQEFGFISPTLNTFFAETKGKNSQSTPESSATGGLIALGAIALLFMRKRH